MSEIEKMYRTAKVVPSHHYCNDCQYDMSAEIPTYDICKLLIQKITKAEEE